MKCIFAITVLKWFLGIFTKKVKYSKKNILKNPKVCNTFESFSSELTNHLKPLTALAVYMYGGTPVHRTDCRCVYCVCTNCTHYHKVYCRLASCIYHSKPQWLKLNGQTVGGLAVYCVDVFPT